MEGLTLLIVCIVISFVISALVSFLIINAAITQIFKIIDEKMEFWMTCYQKTTTEILKKAGILK